MIVANVQSRMLHSYFAFVIRYFTRTVTSF